MLATDIRNPSPESLSTGEMFETTFDVTSAGEKLKATMVYTDVAAAPAAVFVPVNDLDLELTSPGGMTYKGNVFAAGLSATGGSADTLNNVEQVHLETPEVGTWTVRVIGTAVNAQTQGFGLVITGAVAEASVGCPADLNADSTVDAGDLAILLAAWGSMDPSANLDGQGTVENSDLAILLAAWGACPN